MSSSAAFVRQHRALFGQQQQQQLFQQQPLAASKVADATDRRGNFGLLADVAIAAAEEQSRLERVQLAAASASAQPIDLSKK